ncbi:MAG: exo-alpha-sialidase [Chlamydiales bacterium]|nr:exo-alpha-sialidase [Chlamydiales bacterium]
MTIDLPPPQEIVHVVERRVPPITITQSNLLWHGVAQTSCKPGSLCQAVDGTILAVWYGGQEFSGNEQEETALWLARYKDGVWSKPECIYSEEGYHIWNPVLIVMPSGKVKVNFRKFLPIVPEPQKEKFGVREFIYQTLESADNGLTWTNLKTLPEGFTGPAKTAPYIIDDKTWLVPSVKDGKSRLEYTNDAGTTWQILGPILREDGSSNMTEPCIVPAEDGTYHIYLRNRQKESATRHVMLANFNPDTLEITPALDTNIPNPDSGIDVIRLQNGRLLMAANPSFTDRSSLVLYRSYDNGKTWETALVLENEKGEFAQASLLQSSDGRVHVLYYYWLKDMPDKNIKHVVVKFA